MAKDKQKDGLDSSTLYAIAGAILFGLLIYHLFFLEIGIKSTLCKMAGQKYSIFVPNECRFDLDGGYELRYVIDVIRDDDHSHSSIISHKHPEYLETTSTTTTIPLPDCNFGDFNGYFIVDLERFHDEYVGECQNETCTYNYNLKECLDSRICIPTKANFVGGCSVETNLTEVLIRNQKFNEETTTTILTSKNCAKFIKSGKVICEDITYPETTTTILTSKNCAKFIKSGKVICEDITYPETTTTIPLRMKCYDKDGNIIPRYVWNGTAWEIVHVEEYCEEKLKETTTTIPENCAELSDGTCGIEGSEDVILTKESLETTNTIRPIGQTYSIYEVVA